MRFVVKYKSPAAMARSRANRSQTKSTVMTMTEFDMEVVNINSRAELKSWEANDDVLFVEEGEW